MKTRVAICLAFVAISAAVLPVSASAQALLPPYEITTSARSMGLAPISPPVRRGDRYVLRAIDRRGAEVTVAADAQSGRILFVRPVGYGARPVYAERVYPRAYPEEFVPPPRSIERQRSYQQPRSYGQQGNYEQQGNFERPPRNPPEPSVIYAPRDNVNAPQAPSPAPSAAKPPANKVAAKPAAKPAAAAESNASKEQSDDITGATAALSPAENPALAIPPVQTLE